MSERTRRRRASDDPRRRARSSDPAIERELAELRDRAGLADLVASYARGVDRRDFDSVASLFIPGGRILVFDGPDTSVKAPRQLVADGTMEPSLERALQRYLVTTHIIGQQTADIDGDAATAETYCLAHHVLQEDGEWVNRVMSIRYQDTCRRVDEVEGGEWRFLERRLAVDWVEVRPLGMPPDWA